MKQIQSFWYACVDTIQAASLVDLLDILVVAFLIYSVIALVRRTNSAQIAKGVVLVMVVYAVAYLIGMRTLRYLIQSIITYGIIAMVVVFQPELRRSLEQLGHTKILGSDLFRPRTDPENDRLRWQEAVVAVCDAAEQLAETRTGALIVLERRTNLSEIIKTGTSIHAEISPELLRTIFYEGTALHDGAVVVRDAEIHSAGCFLPLSNNLEIGKDMGTRHRAALGMSENSDAVVVVVSEETGIISLAKSGVLIRRLDRQSLFNLLEADLVPALPEQKKPPFWAFWRKRDE